MTESTPATVGFDVPAEPPGRVARLVLVAMAMKGVLVDVAQVLVGLAR